MGMMLHHAIIVTGSDQRLVVEAQSTASMLGLVVSLVTRSKANCYYSFAVLPDGSKEGWEESKKMDERREILVKMLSQYPLDWVGVQFANEVDDGGAKIVRDSSTVRRGRGQRD
jgi:hypothetical protein